VVLSAFVLARDDHGRQLGALVVVTGQRFRVPRLCATRIAW
jgi:hypothetical protein